MDAYRSKRVNTYKTKRYALTAATLSINLFNIFFLAYVLLEMLIMFDTPFIWMLNYSAIVGLVFIRRVLMIIDSPTTKPLHTHIAKYLKAVRLFKKALRKSMRILIGYGVAYVLYWIITQFNS